MSATLQTLMLGLITDIEVMAENGFSSISDSYLEALYLCFCTVNMGRKTVSPIVWQDCFNRYGINNYSHIGRFIERNMSTAQRAMISRRLQAPLEVKKRELRNSLPLASRPKVFI